MNLAYHYPIIYWNTACLSINAGADEDNEDNKSTNYGKVATAIGNMQQKGIKIVLPDINKAEFGFTPDAENNQIVFALKAMNGIGDEIVNLILSNRPYTSFQDFLDKNYKKEEDKNAKVSSKEDTEDDSIVTETDSTGKKVATYLKNNQIIKLIKAGCFDELEPTKTREEVMAEFITLISEPKKQLTLQNLNTLVNYGLIPKEQYKYVRIMDFKKYLLKHVHEEIPNRNPKVKKKFLDRNLFCEEKATKFFDNYFSTDCIVGYEESGILISENKFNKEYDKLMNDFRVWISKPELLEAVNEKLFEDLWSKRCKGSISTWEMDALSYYYHEHELAHVDKERYGIVDFNDLPELPEVEDTYIRNGQVRYKFKLHRLVGTVLDRNKHKHLITLLTPSGVVSVKMYEGDFIHYDKQISEGNEDGTKSILEKSFFTRGNKIMVCGFRSGNQFKAHRYSNSIMQHKIALIESITEDGILELQTERISVE